LILIRKNVTLNTWSEPAKIPPVLSRFAGALSDKVWPQIEWLCARRADVATREGLANINGNTSAGRPNRNMGAEHKVLNMWGKIAEKRDGCGAARAGK
jgi:hypothetical protein